MQYLHFNGSNTFGTIKICSKQGRFELISVNHSARSGGIFSIFLNMRVFCVFSLESHQRSDSRDSNEYTQYTISQYEKKITLRYPKSAAMGFSKGLMNKFKTAMRNEPSVFKPLIVY